MWLEQIVQANSSLESRESVSIVSSLEEMPTIFFACTLIIYLLITYSVVPLHQLQITQTVVSV
jgi:hypothetical protein